jgi:hypothetical protein
MPTVETSSRELSSSTTDAQSIWRQIRAHLEEARQRLSTEISNYPAPRPACDADFNHLLEERARIADELNRLPTAATLAPAKARHEIEAFITESPFLDTAGKRKFGAMLGKLPR